MLINSVTQASLILCDPMDCSSPGSSIHRILQARILVWVAISSSRGSSWPRTKPASFVSPVLAGRFFTSEPPGKPRQSQMSSWGNTKHQNTVCLNSFPLNVYAHEVWELSNLGYVSSNIMLIPSCQNFHCHFNIHSVQFSCSVVSDPLWPYGL